MLRNFILINADGPEQRVAIVEGGVLAELHIERPSERGLVGNIYKGKVLRVLPGMQAAFVDVGIGKAAFLYAGDIVHDLGQEESDEPEEATTSADVVTPAATQPPIPSITEIVQPGQELLVQVAKEPVGTKGARITNYLSLPGRHLVLLPTVDHVGISRRIVNEEERARLKRVIEEVRPTGTGFIVRTVAEGMDEASLKSDMEYLLKLWDEVRQRSLTQSAPSLIYRDLDLALRVVRDLVSTDIERLIIDDPEEYERISQFTATFAPRYAKHVTLYQNDEPLFDAYGIEHEIDQAMDRKVWLKSGGYLVIDRGEALTAIDVNTGKYVGRRNLEDTITKINLEAVREIATQLRLRNIGGLIVIDFIDMEQEANRQKVWRALQDALKADRAKSNVLSISALGLVEMTRQRMRTSLSQKLAEPCPYCEGKGHIKSAMTVCYEVLRELRRQAADLPGDTIVIEVHPDVANLLADVENERLTRLEQRFAKTILVEPLPQSHLEQFAIHLGA